jgi:hypothetical protein
MAGGVRGREGANTSLYPLYAWARRGRWVFESARRNWGVNVTLLASLGAEGRGPSLAVEGATTREVLRSLSGTGLGVPTLHPGRVV